MLAAEMETSYPVEAKVWGRFACFTRPEEKVERVSYPLPPPTAAVGILEAIYWKPEFAWEVTEVHLLPHPERIGRVDWMNTSSITLNEVSAESHPQEYEVPRDRVQRTCTILNYPCYLIRARARGVHADANFAAIRRQFQDRVRAGQCFHQPSLGLRQFTAFFSEASAEDVPLPVSADVGLVPARVELNSARDRAVYRFCRAVVHNGVCRFMEVGR